MRSAPILTASSVAVLPVPVAAQDPDAEDVTLTVMASQDWIKPAEQELAEKFEAETGIHVDYQIIPADQYFNVLKTKLNAGEAADIFGGQTGKSDLKLQYDVENNAVDLTGEEWTTRIDPAALDMSSLDGKVYGAEIWDIIASNYFVMVYNKDIFEELGHQRPHRLRASSRRPAPRSWRPGSRRSTSPSRTAGITSSGSPMVGPALRGG